MAYLNDFGFSPEVGKDAYIPENIFYRLAMKARNETAERFQALTAAVQALNQRMDAVEQGGGDASPAAPAGAEPLR